MYMEVVVLVAVVIVAIQIYYYASKKKEKKEHEPKESVVAQEIAPEKTTGSEVVPAEKMKGTRDLFLETLKKIGCQYELSEEDGEDSDKIVFFYQGETFVASANNEGMYVHIWDFQWEHVELYDIDEFSRLRKAINISNKECATTTVFSIDEAGGTVNVHCKAVILFFEHIPNIEDYLRVELNDFFRAHHTVTLEMAKLREEDNKKVKTLTGNPR